MISLYLKEIRSFFGSLIAFMVIFVFLLLNSLFLWIFPGEYNILDNGFASLDNFFMLAPLVFMFLIPAVTMRSFSEELKNGTFELLATKPISDLHIVLAKYFSSFTVVLIATLPTLVFFYSVYQLGQPVGNMDVGGTLGSFIGLIFMASSYTAIGIFSSSLSNNQIVSFIIAIVLCFFMYLGIDAIAGLFPTKLSSTIQQLGINYHYTSLSLGVIDITNLIFFVVLNGLLIRTTILKTQSRKW
jgi:ABC-2 type transport system permease protein